MNDNLEYDKFILKQFFFTYHKTMHCGLNYANHFEYVIVQNRHLKIKHMNGFLIKKKKKVPI